ncbi:MAG: aminotransferase class V-fold PLP-dependent enzyme [Holophagae bacterium]
MNGTERIYLDHGATSWPKAPGVTESVARFLEHDAGNPGRGGHRLTVAASRAIEGAREEVAALLGGDPERTLFGPGATFWLNTVLRSVLHTDDRVVTSALEHNAVMRPLRRLEATERVEIAVVDGSEPDGLPDADAFRGRVAEAPTSLVVVTHASNVTGAVLPVAEIAAAVAPVPVLVDGAQTAGSVPFGFGELGVAAFACSGHKGLLGPPGVGVLLLADGFEIEPLVRGGTGSRSESEEMPSHLPDRLEAGTPNGPGVAGLGAGCRWLTERGIDGIGRTERRLARRLVDGLRDIDGVTVHGWRDDAAHVGIVSFTVTGADTGTLATQLDRGHGIMLRSGLHCAPAAHRRIGTFPDGTLRAGVGPFNTEDDVDALLSAVAEFSILNSEF